MFAIGVKGSIGVIIGSIAIMLLLFGINSANNSAEQNQTMLNLQIAKETALNTENLIRMLDKATSKVISDGANPVCGFFGPPISFENKYKDVITDYTTATSSPMGCTINISSASGNPTVTVTGTLNCSIELGDFRSEDIRPFSFQKIISGAVAPCIVTDVISGCQEQPGFSC